MGENVGYTKDTTMEEKEGEEKQERIMTCNLPRLDQTLYRLLQGNQLKVFHEYEMLLHYIII